MAEAIDIFKDTIKADEEKLELSNSDDQTTLKLRVKNFPDEKSYISFIKQVERQVRASSEYRLWTTYVKDILGYKFCSVTLESTEDVTIEIHHWITLYDIVTMVVDTKIMKNIEFSSFDISAEVIELHYKGWVGYIPLVSTMHEKVHSGSLKIPKHMVFGEWKKMIETYFVNEDVQHRINNIISVKPEEMLAVWKKDEYPGAVKPMIGEEVKDGDTEHTRSIGNDST